MATTFDVIYLGTYTDINPNEGTNLIGNGTALEGETAGSPSTPLWGNVQTLALGTDADGDGFYDIDNNNSNDTFTIDGGAEQVFDSVARYDSTITYSNGSSVTATIIVFQDTTGGLYLVPQKTDNADQAALEAHPIEQITLDTYAGSYWSGISPDFEPASFVVPVCLAEGTHVRTPRREVLVEDLRPGDLVVTKDNGPRRLRWVCRREIDFMDPENHRAALDRPICFSKGSLGAGIPEKDLAVSPQHRMLATVPAGDGAARREVLVPAKGLLGQSGVRQMRGKRSVVYFALVLDCHEIVFAEGALVESFRPGPIGLRGLDRRDRAAVLSIYKGLRYFPDLALGAPARPLWSVGQYRKAMAQTELAFS